MKTKKTKQKKSMQYRPHMADNMPALFLIAARGNTEEAERLARRVQALADASASRAKARA